LGSSRWGEGCCLLSWLPRGGGALGSQGRATHPGCPERTAKACICAGTHWNAPERTGAHTNALECIHCTPRSFATPISLPITPQLVLAAEICPKRLRQKIWHKMVKNECFRHSSQPTPLWLEMLGKLFPAVGKLVCIDFGGLVGDTVGGGGDCWLVSWLLRGGGVLGSQSRATHRGSREHTARACIFTGTHWNALEGTGTGQMH
jgi:hypothetical protein